MPPDAVVARAKSANAVHATATCLVIEVMCLGTSAGNARNRGSADPRKRESAARPGGYATVMRARLIPLVLVFSVALVLAPPGAASGSRCPGADAQPDQISVSAYARA